MNKNPWIIVISYINLNNENKKKKLFFKKQFTSFETAKNFLKNDVDFDKIKKDLPDLKEILSINVFTESNFKLMI